MNTAGNWDRPPAVAQRILNAVLPDSHREVVAGDLEEAYTAFAEQEGVWKANWWYRKEVAITLCHGARWRLAAWLRKNTSSTITQENRMLPVGTATNRPLAFAVSIGVLGYAISFALIPVFLPRIIERSGHDGWWMRVLLMEVCGYGLLFLATTLFLRAERVSLFSQRLALSIGAFLTMMALQHGVPIAFGIAMRRHPLMDTQQLTFAAIWLATGIVSSVVVARVAGASRIPAAS